MKKKKCNKDLSIRELANRFFVPKSTLQDRCHGKLSKLESSKNNQIMTPIEEDSLTKWVIYLTSIGVPPTHEDVRKMANQILAARGKKPALEIGKNWLPRFLNRTKKLTVRLAKTRDYVRSYCETPEKFADWFDRVVNTIIEFGIAQEDVYNVDETGFATGILAMAKVITGTDFRDDPEIIQPGNREWVSVIECVSAGGVALPPFVIFAAAKLQRGWYKDLPKTWRLGHSPNGWTNDKLALRWLNEIFVRTTTLNRTGKYCLLLFDGHGSHLTPEFADICEKNCIKVQCMPPHASHRLQPLDLVCFSVLKRAYRKLINERVKLRVHSINKFEFLKAYPEARKQAFRQENIMSAFRTAGLFPHDPDHVISKLPHNVCEPLSEQQELPEVTQEDGQESSQDEPQTPSRYKDFKLLASSIGEMLPQVPKGVRSPLKEKFDLLVNMSHMFFQSAHVLAHEVTCERTAYMILKNQKSQPKRQFILESDLFVEEVEDMFSLTDIQQESSNIDSDTVPSSGSPRRKRRPYLCGKCGISGHTIKKCPLSTE